MNLPLIGLTGPARCGKDTIALHLVLMYSFAQYAFANPLREGLIAIFNLSPCDFEGAQKEQPIAWLGRSPRELMQTLGTDWGRHLVHPETWLLVAEQNLRFLAEVEAAANGFVISDVRFENEADFIRKRGGIVIHVLRPDAPRVNEHISESGVSADEKDLVIVNDGDLDALFLKVDDVMQLIASRAAYAA